MQLRIYALTEFLPTPKLSRGFLGCLGAEATCCGTGWLQAALRGMTPGEVLHLLGAPEAAPTTDATAHMRSALRCAFSTQHSGVFSRTF